jgi:hypothetical protein
LVVVMLGSSVYKVVGAPNGIICLITCMKNRQGQHYEEGRVGEMRIANRIVARRYARKRSFERLKRRWRVNIGTVVIALTLYIRTQCVPRCKHC